MKKIFYNFRSLKTLFVFILFTFISIDSYSQYQIRHYDMFCTDEGQDYGRSVINRVDNGYAIAGYSYQNPACIGSYEWMFIKLKPTGLIDCATLLGMSKDDKCYSVVQSSGFTGGITPGDSGFFLAGYTTNLNSPFRKKATLTKLSKNCSLLGSRAITDTLNSNYYQVTKDTLGSFSCAGFQEVVVTIGYLRNKILVSNYTNSGSLNWAYKYVAPGLSKEEAYSICYQKASNTYGVAARTNYYSGSSGVYDILLMKLSSTGAIIWRSVYRIALPTGSPYPNTEPRKIIPMADGGFTVVGFTNAYLSGQQDIIVLRVNSTGGIVWSRTYGTTYLSELGESIAQDGAYFVITGSEREISPAMPPNAFIMKIPETGGFPLWTRTWDNSSVTDAGYDIIKSTISEPEGYAVTGQTSRPVVFNDPFLWRTNASGLISGVTAPCEESITLTRINNIHKTDSFTINRTQLSDVTRPCTAVNPTTLVTTKCLSPTDTPEKGFDDEDVKEYSLKQNSPNPFNPVTTINFELPVSGFATIKVFDISGRLVSTPVNEFKEMGRHHTSFDGTNLSSGVYYYKIESEGFSDIKKMILIK